MGHDTRPSRTRVKEALFNILAALEADFFYNKNILDLFAGSGALGYEAISRGAARALFVENETSAIEAIKYNNSKIGFENKCQILKADATQAAYLSQYSKQYNWPKFDVIFADPPYDKNLGQKAFEQLLEYQLVKENSIFILEEAKKAQFSFPAALKLLKHRDYGITSLYILELTNA